MQTTQWIIELRGVSRVFATANRRHAVLNNVSLRVARGAFVAIVGKSGSGKSTLLNIIAGLDRPTHGQVVVDGVDVHSLSEDGLATWRGKNVGVVFQAFHLLPTLTVLENVLLPIDLNSELPAELARQRAIGLLRLLGVMEHHDKFPTALSGGEQQRVAIARALANDPPLIVADEPTGNLDTQTAREVLDLLGGLVERGRTVLMVTHEQTIREAVQDVVVLSDGAVVDSIENHRRRPMPWSLLANG